MAVIPPRRFCRDGESDGKKILKIPPTVLKWRIRLRPAKLDTIYLKYRNKIEERFLLAVDGDHVEVSPQINGINITSREPESHKKKKDFWKV